MITVVVFGGSGSLGRAVISHLQGQAITYSPSRGHCDIASIDTVRWYLSRYRPDVIINCAGVIPDRGDSEPAMVSANALGPHVLAQVADEIGSRLIHVSTDCVFQPSTGVRWTPDRPDAQTLYGRSKALGEVTAEHVANVRCSFLTPDHGLARWFLTLPYEAEVEGYMLKAWNGSTVEEIATRLVWLALGRYGWRNIHHLATADVISKSQVLRVLQANFRPDVRIKHVKGPFGYILYPTIECRPLDKAIDDMGVRQRYKSLALSVLNA